MPNKTVPGMAMTAVVLVVLMAGCNNNGNVPQTPSAQVKATEAVAAVTQVTQATQVQLQIQPQTQQSVTIDDSLLAMALLAPEDMSGITMFGHARPHMTSLDAHLDDKGKVYDFYDLKYWDDRTTGYALMDNAVTKYPNPEAADEDVLYLAEGYDKVAVKDQIGGAQAVYFEPAVKNSFATVTYRFTQGEIGAKITIYFQSSKADTSTAGREAMAEIAAQLAKKQATRIGNLLSGKYATASNESISQLPGKLSGTKLIGTVPVTDQEWLGTEKIYKKDSLPGFVDAGLRRFSIVARPHEVAEVLYIRFGTADEAQKYFKDREPDAKDTGIEIVALPKSLTEKGANAIYDKDGDIYDLEAVKGNYLVDLAIFSPFDEVDKAAAKKDMIKMAEETL